MHAFANHQSRRNLVSSQNTRQCDDYLPLPLFIVVFIDVVTLVLIRHVRYDNTFFVLRNEPTFTNYCYFDPGDECGRFNLSTTS